MKKTLLLLAMGAFIALSNMGCHNGNKQTSSIISVDSFLLSPEKWAGQDVQIKGTISHVCRHSGKKCFLFGKDAEKTVKVNAGGDHATFDIKAEGTDVEITGTVVEDEKIDANYLNEWEADIKKSVEDKDQKVCNEENKAITGQTACKEKTKDTVVDPYAEVNEFRKKLAASGKTYIPIYAINCKTMKEAGK
jgi:hypothetical protein